MGLITRIIQAGSRWAKEHEIGTEVRFKRTHHHFLHPTKGWRMFARHGKANRRRKLIHQGVLMIHESHAGGVYLRSILGGWRLSKCRAFYNSVFARG